MDILDWKNSLENLFFNIIKDKNMKPLITTALLSATFFSCSFSAFADPIDLSGWSPVVLLNDSHSSPTWTISPGGDSVTQSKNGDASVFLSDQTWTNTVFNGNFSVNTTGDDDYIGFVFGYTSSSDYYLFDWKQRDQNWHGQGKEGFTLSHITGNDINLWDHSGNDINVLADDYSSTNGWEDNTSYQFTLSYTAGNINISIDGTTIFDIDGTYDPGKFGFYNYSQPNVSYQGFTQTAAVPEPATMLLFGAGLAAFAGGTLRRRNSR